MARSGRYTFSWELLGDLDVGRPNLGRSTRVEIYRLMQFTLRAAIERRLGTEQADELFFEAGYTAGAAFYDNLIQTADSVESLFASVQRHLRELQVGVLRVEESDPDGARFVLTVSEDLDCSGLPLLDHEICTYDEGFLAGILERYTGQHFRVKEVDCWCTGDRTCRFLAERVIDSKAAGEE
jgi:uncharacterized protein